MISRQDARPHRATQQSKKPTNTQTPSVTRTREPSVSTALEHTLTCKQPKCHSDHVYQLNVSVPESDLYVEH